MPSTVVHVALAGLLAVALLQTDFDWRALLIVCGAVVFIDLDTILGWWFVGAHRAAFHTFLLPALLVGLLVVDLWVGDRSILRERFPERGPRIAGVSVVAIVFAGIGPDLFTNGANVFYPIHDQFYKLNGHVLLSDERGFVQTFVDLSAPESGSSGSSDVGEVAVGSTEEVNDTYWTGVDPEPSNPGSESTEDVERVFPIVQTGRELLLVLTSTVVVGSRLIEERYR